MARWSLLVLVIASFVICAIADDDEEKYSDKYDYLDVDKIITNDRLRNQYYKCFLDSAPCVTADALFFKEKFPEALVTKCRKCTDKQRYAFERIVLWYAENAPEEWDAVLQKAVRDFQQKGIERKLKEKVK